MHFAVNIGQGLRCPLTESMDTVVYVDEQRMHRSDCMVAHADLEFRCSLITYEPLFSRYACLIK